jgi:hypothetical protein
MIILPGVFDHRSTEGAVLFGSQARGDADSRSDIDVAVFVNAIDVDTLSGLKKTFLADCDCQQLALSVYSTRTAEVLASDGSLFLWHLRLEGKVLFQRDGWLSKLLNRLAPYGKSKALRDVATFERIIRDVDKSLETGEHTTLFEVATIYSVLRNLGMIYSYVTGMPCFGRIRPIHILSRGMGERFPFANSEVATLEKFRLAYTRAALPLIRNPDVRWCLTASQKVAEVLRFLKGELDGG